MKGDESSYTGDSFTCLDIYIETRTARQYLRKGWECPTCNTLNRRRGHSSFASVEDTSHPQRSVIYLAVDRLLNHGRHNARYASVETTAESRDTHTHTHTHTYIYIYIILHQAPTSERKWDVTFAMSNTQQGARQQRFAGQYPGEGRRYRSWPSDQELTPIHHEKRSTARFQDLLMRGWMDGTSRLRKQGSHLARGFFQPRSNASV